MLVIALSLSALEYLKPSTHIFSSFYYRDKCERRSLAQPHARIEHKNYHQRRLQITSLSRKRCVRVRPQNLHLHTGRTRYLPRRLRRTIGCWQRSSWISVVEHSMRSRIPWRLRSYVRLPHMDHEHHRLNTRKVLLSINLTSFNFNTWPAFLLESRHSSAFFLFQRASVFARVHERPQIFNGKSTAESFLCLNFSI